jgi:hypothetical protein
VPAWCKLAHNNTGGLLLSQFCSTASVGLEWNQTDLILLGPPPALGDIFLLLYKIAHQKIIKMASSLFVTCDS